jgi:rhodanese-related sulfurtransferase
MSATRTLGAGALLLGLAAPFAGSPYLPAQGGIDVDGLARVIASGDDHVTASDLAGWIRDRKQNLRVIDVRGPDAFAAYSIPTAENIPIDRLARAAFSKDEIIVLYSEGGAHAGQAWVLLRALGLTNVFFIAGGMVDWHEEIMAPELPVDASEEERRAFEARADLSRYFGGEPQIGPARGEATARPAAERARVVVRRRGC